METKPRTAPQRGFNFDYIMWLFTRLSALGMYALAFVGITAALLMGARQNMSLADLMRWGFMPESTHVINTNITNIEAWKSLFWQIMGVMMVLLAAGHGFHGLLNVIEDYLSSARLRATLRLVVLGISVVMITVAIYVVFTA
jgi:succinate dehydrogenase hydrophobic anchor subunit